MKDEDVLKGAVPTLLSLSPLNLVLIAGILLMTFLVILAWKLLPHLVTAGEQRRREFRALDTEEKEARLRRLESWSQKVHSIDGIQTRLNVVELDVREAQLDIKEIKKDSGDQRVQVAKMAGSNEEAQRMLTLLSPRKDRD